MHDESDDKRIEEITSELRTIERRKRELTEELRTLKSLTQDDSERQQFLGTPAREHTPKNSQEKMALFLDLFRCRSDVYPNYWEKKAEKIDGYSPACRNEWVSEVCLKKIKKSHCRDCPGQSFLPFDEKAAYNHLTGRNAIGSYAIDANDMCTFLAADFDKKSWREDALAFKQCAVEMQVDASVEVSKSGNGAHAWIFFSEHVPARKARRLGELILHRALESQNKLQLNSYDRFFPNQDLLPSGGFGSLIYLPLQKKKRDDDHCVFVDDECIPYEKQWDYLAHRFLLSEQDIDTVLDTYSRQTFELSNTNSFDDAKLLFRVDTPKRRKKRVKKDIILTLKGQIAVALNALSEREVLLLKKIAVITNPKYFQAQKMRFSTWNIPKYIFCGDNDDQFIYLPRGLSSELITTLEAWGYSPQLDDRRNRNEPLSLTFSGTLFEYQKEAVEQLVCEDNAVLVAPTGTGKTIIGIALIARRNVRTLILVHRSTLIDQWISALCSFLPEIEKKHIGVLGNGRKKLKGTIDIGMLQTVAKYEDVETLTEGYDFVIIDECHRVPTVTFEPVLKAMNARYVLGLTATPIRKDRFEAIIFMQCGAIAHTIGDVNLKNQIRKVYFRTTAVPEITGNIAIQTLWEIITESQKRNEQIVTDIKDLLFSGRSPVVLSDRTEHLDCLQSMLSEQSTCVKLKLRGSMGKKERREVFETIRSCEQEHTPYCLFATGSFIGEGFDLPELDTMLITMPISFKGRLTQYVGRLHRAGTETKEILVYDYVDTCSAITISMFKKRLVAYKKLEYAPVYNPHDVIARWL